MSNVYVSSAAELMTALNAAAGGETLVLAQGNYGTLDLLNTTFAQTVTIRSADAGNPAVFDSVSLTGVENLAFADLTFDYVSEAGAPNHIRTFSVLDSANISITNSVFDGDLAHGLNAIEDGYGTGVGLNVKNSVGIDVSGNEFFNWRVASGFRDVQDLVLDGNDMHSLTSDAMTFTSIDGATITNNHLHDLRRAPDSGDHADLIQFSVNIGDMPSKNILIEGNVLNSGSGDPSQSIFMRNEAVDGGLAGVENFYQNITIRDNVIYSGHHNGIFVGQTDGLVIENNTVLVNARGPDNTLIGTPSLRVREESQDVHIANNIVPAFDYTPAEGWFVSNNLVVQRDDPTGENYVGDLFVDALADGEATLYDLQALPGGMVEQLGLGSSMTRFDGSPESPLGFIDASAEPGLGMMTHGLDASNVFGPNGLMDLSGATVAWDFGDGTSGTGMTGSHTWARSGSYDVRAVVTLESGETVTMAKTIQVQTPLALNANFDSGAEDLSDQPNTSVVGDKVTFEGSDGDMAARLNGGMIYYEPDAALVNNAEYTLILDFKKDAGNETSAGTLLTFASSFGVTVGAEDLSVSVSSDQGAAWLNSSSAGLNDAEWHRMVVTFSGEDGAAVLYLDGTEVARVTGLDGAIQEGNAGRKLFVGDPGGESFAGLIDNFQFWKGAMSAEQIETMSSRNAEGKFEPLAGASAGPTRGDTVLPDPEVVESDAYVAISADFDAGAEDLSDQPNAVTVEPVVTFEGTDGNMAARLNGGMIYYEPSAALVNNSAYTLVLDFKKDSGDDAGGTLIAFPSSFSAAVDGNGLEVSVSTDQGASWLNAANVGLDDTAWHRLVVTFSGEDGAAILYLDGVEVSRVTGLDGAVQVGSERKLFLGDPGGDSFGGLIDNFQFSQSAMSAAEVEALSTRALDGRFAPLNDAATDDTTTEPVDDTTSDPVDDTTTEPVDDTPTEPVDDATTEPVDDTPTEPVDDTTTEPVDDTPTEPVDDTAPDYGDVEFQQEIVGTAGGDNLRGHHGADYIEGLGGDDVLRGHHGNDVLVGGKGMDSLNGGSGRDTFVFTDIAESLPGSRQRDRIDDFTPGEDKIDVSRIDAVTGGGHDAFVFIGTDGFSAAGQLRQFESGRGSIIEGDVDGDGRADFEIALLTADLVLTQQDFVG